MALARLGLPLLLAHLALPAAAAPLDDRLLADLAIRPAQHARLLASAPAEAIGAAYEWGEGVPQDYAAALAWYRRAAEAGEARALVQAGVLLANGMGTERNPQAAAALFRQAAAAGEIEGSVRLGMLYEWGRGVAQDRCEAARLYRDAAERGHMAAGLFLALLPDQDRRAGQTASCSALLS